MTVHVQRIVTGYYTIPTNYTSIGVTVGRAAQSPIDRQPVIISPSRPTKMEEPQTAVLP